MPVGFVFWYRALARGRIAEVGQLQLQQPFSGLMRVPEFLHETIQWAMLASTAVAMLCVVGARRLA